MDISSVVVGFGVAFFWAIFKVIEYLISKKRGAKWGKEQEEKLNELHAIILLKAKESDRVFNNLNNILQLIDERVKHLDDMHSIYDENLIPRWYLPADMIKMVRQIYNNLETTCKEIEDGFSEVEDRQSILSERVIDLITSQKIMVERLGDLINKLNRISSN